MCEEGILDSDLFAQTATNLGRRIDNAALEVNKANIIKIRYILEHEFKFPP